MTLKRIILPLALLFLSCTKQEEGGRQEESFDQHPTWMDSDSNDFWGKRSGGGFILDTTWDGGTTLYF